MTLLQTHLRNGGSLLELVEKYAIKSTRHSLFPNLVLFKYNQIESPFGEAIVRECRGIILDELNNWEIVARPFDKFFNHGEGHAAPIDWSTAKVQEKVDGSLVTLYHYNGQWNVATSGTPDAGGNVSDFGFTFAQLFWKTFFDNVPKIDLDTLYQGACYMFELTSPYNKVVVRHDASSLTVLGGRDLTTQKEMTAEEAAAYFPTLKAVKGFPLTSFDEIISTFPSINPMSQEGYVVVDTNFNRVKVKSPAYVALHHLKDSLGSSIRHLVQVVLNGEIDEVVAALPEYKDELANIKVKLTSLISELETAYDKIKDVPVQKDFALEAVKTRYSPALFAVRAGKSASIRAHLQKIQVDSVVSLLGLKEKPSTDQSIDLGTYSTK